MTTAIRGRLAACTLTALVLAPAAAAAEWFLDVYGGRSWTRPADVHIEGIDILGIPVSVILQEVDRDDSFLVGLRIGYWLGFLPDIGVAVDAFHFRPDVRSRGSVPPPAARPLALGARGRPGGLRTGGDREGHRAAAQRAGDGEWATG